MLPQILNTLEIEFFEMTLVLVEIINQIVVSVLPSTWFPNIHIGPVASDITYLIDIDTDAT